MKEQESEEAIERFVVDYLAERGADIDPSDPLGYDFVSSGVIDSFETLAFLLVLEESFEVKIKPEDFLDNDYRIVGKLIEAIISKRP